MLGFGTFGLGGYFEKDASKDEKWKAAIKFAIRHKHEWLDTAEIYGAGHTDELVGKAIKGKKVKVIEKLSPKKRSRKEIFEAGVKVRSILGKIDVVMLHAPYLKKIKEQVAGLVDLKESGVAKEVGLSNFSLKQLQEITKQTDIFAIENEFNLYINDFELLEFCKDKGIIYFAYSPLGRGDLFTHPKFNIIEKIAEKLNKTPAQIAIRWVLEAGTIPIVKAENPKHIIENEEVLKFELGNSWQGLRNAFKK